MRTDIRKKKRILPVLLGLLALSFASYRFLFAPELRAIAALREEIARKEVEVTDAIALRTAVEETRGGGGKLLDLKLRSWEQRVPVTPQNERLLAEIAEQAVRHRLGAFGLTSVPVSPPQAAGEAAADGAAPGETVRMPEVRYRMTFRSTYRDLAEFLDDIPRMRRLLTVRSVAVRGEGEVMTATVEISAWYRGTP